MRGSPAGATRGSEARGLRQRPWWPWTRRVLVTAFLTLVAALLWQQAQSIEWTKVARVLRGYPLSTLAFAALFAAASHLLYTTFDLLGRRWTGHALPVATVMRVTFVSYAFNLNLGSLVGGVGFRFRLYGRLGLSEDEIARVLGLSMATNWLGYGVLAGALFALGVVSPPEEWRLSGLALRALGGATLALALGYVALCAFSNRRTFALRGYRFTLPVPRLALLQLAVSVVNWMAIGAVIWVLLQDEAAYAQVLGVLLVAAVAGVIAHVPAGLGVLEVVFITLLAQVGEPRVLGALLAYRAIYYLAPLAIALGLYAALEAKARRGP